MNNEEDRIPWKDMLGVGLTILGLILAVVLIAATSGCTSVKSRSVEVGGMYASDTGQLAIGKVTVDAVPEDGESAIIHYSEDTAWLSPTTKTHKIDVFLTGTESASHAKDIASGICEAFVAVKGQGPRVEGQGSRVEGQGPRVEGQEECEDCVVPATND